MEIFACADHEIAKKVFKFAQEKFPHYEYLLFRPPTQNLSIIRLKGSAITLTEIIQEDIIKLALNCFAEGLTYSEKETEPIYNAYLCMDTCPYNIGYCKKYMESLTNDSVMCNMKIRCKKCVDHYGFDN
jgi:hypothetical protein